MFAIAGSVLTFLTVAFLELLLVFTVTLLASLVLALSLAAFEDRITGKGARFALAAAILGVLVAAYAGLMAGAMSPLSAGADSSGAVMLDGLMTALFLGGVPLLVAGTVVGAYFARVRAAGSKRLKWVALEASVYATLAYMGYVVVSAIVRGLF